jgi:hypothetical protein
MPLWPRSARECRGADRWVDTSERCSAEPWPGSVLRVRPRPAPWRSARRTPPSSAERHGLRYCRRAPLRSALFLDRSGARSAAGVVLSSTAASPWLLHPPRCAERGLRGMSPQSVRATIGDDPADLAAPLRRAAGTSVLHRIGERIAAPLPWPAGDLLNPGHPLGDPFLGELLGHGCGNPGRQGVAPTNVDRGESSPSPLDKTDALFGPVRKTRRSADYPGLNAAHARLRPTITTESHYSVRASRSCSPRVSARVGSRLI